MPFTNSLKNPLIYSMETCTREPDEEKLKCPENCCICMSPSDVAPLYAIEIAKLWIRQNCGNAEVPLGCKRVNVTQRNDQQIKDIHLMKSEVGQCQQIKDIGVMTSQERVTQSQEIKDIGVMTSQGAVTQSQEMKDIGVMTSQEQVTQSQQIKDIGVMTSQGKVSQSQQIKDIDVMTSGEVTVHQQKSFSDAPTINRKMAINGPADYETLPLSVQVAKCSKKDPILDSRSMRDVHQKSPENNKQHTAHENNNYLVPVSCLLKERESQIIQQTKISPTPTCGKNKIMEGSETENSCLCKCANLSASEPTILMKTVNKHVSIESHSLNNKYSKTETTLFASERTEKWCDNPHPIICNVVHRLPLEPGNRRSYTRLLISEESPLCEKVEKSKLCIPELQEPIGTHEKTRVSGNDGISLRKTAPAEQFHPGHEKKDQHQICCSNVHQTKENNGLLETYITNTQINKSNPNPYEDLSANINSEVNCNRISQITKFHQTNVPESQRNTLEFPVMDHHVTYNTESQNKGPWLQKVPKKMLANGYDTKLRKKSYETIYTTEKLKRGHLGNEFQDEVHAFGQYGIREITGKNCSLQFVNRKQKSTEGINTTGMRITFTDLSTKEEEESKKIPKKRSIWSFFQSLRRTIDLSRNRDKQPVYIKSPTPLTFSFKRHKGRKLKKRKIHRETYGLPEEQYIISTSHHDGINTLVGKGQSCNYSPETSTSIEETLSEFFDSNSQHNIESNFKNQRLKHPVLQDFYCDFTNSLEQPKPIQNCNKTNHLIINNKQHNPDRRTNHYKNKSSQVSSKANSQAHDCTRRKEKKCYDQSHIHTERQEAVNLLKDCKYDENMLNRDVTIPFLFRDETSQVKTDEHNKNIVVMVASSHSSTVVINQDIMEELRKQRKDIDSLKKLLDNNKNKTHNTSCFTNTMKSQPQHKNGTTSVYSMPIVPNINENMNFQAIGDTHNAFRPSEQPVSGHILKQKCQSSSLQDYFAFNSTGFKERSPLPATKVKRTQCNFSNNHTNIFHDGRDGYTWRDNTIHGHRRVEKKHIHYVIQRYRKYKTSVWNKVLNLFR